LFLAPLSQAKKERKYVTASDIFRKTCPTRAREQLNYICGPSLIEYSEKKVFWLSIPGRDDCGFFDYTRDRYTSPYSKDHVGI